MKFIGLLTLATVTSISLTALSQNQSQKKGQSQNLSMQTFLEQVRTNNLSLKASDNLKQGSLLYKDEGALLVRPQLSASAVYADDSRITQNPALLGDRTISKTYTLGISQTTTFGLTGKLSYALSDLNVRNAAGGALADFQTGSPTLELSQSLWRNGFGRETRATQELLEASALSTRYLESYKMTARMTEAEVAYYRLALARQSIQTQKTLLERSQKVVDWASRRARLGLGDKADSIQASAGVQLRQLDLQGAIDEERNASRAFNALRNIDSDTVSEPIDPLTPEIIQTLSTPIREDMREDVKAAEQYRRVSEANATMSVEKNKPSLDVFGSVSYNSRETTTSEAMNKSFQSEHPYYVVGVRFASSLDFGTMSDAREGHEKEKLAADLNYRQKIFEQEQDWADLSQKLVEAKRRLKIIDELTKLQEQKLAYERERFNRGRTTTYQVLLFEQDYASAEFNRIRAETDVLRIIAQMKLYGGSR